MCDHGCLCASPPYCVESWKTFSTFRTEPWTGSLFDYQTPKCIISIYPTSQAYTETSTETTHIFMIQEPILNCFELSIFMMRLLMSTVKPS